MRRSKFIPEEDYRREEEVVEERGLDVGRRFVAMKPKQETMWTEITKDLVIREAIEKLGYDFEETEFFFYVMTYLRYVSLFPLSPLPPQSTCIPSTFLSYCTLTSPQEDVLQLVEVSEELRQERRDRIRAIEWERQREREVEVIPERPRKQLAAQPWDEERVFEREIIYDRPPPLRREVREKVYVMR